MRPTDLGFRSPKERTPDFYNPQVTCDGRSLSTTPTKGHQDFPISKRFMQYEVEARRTGFRVGPGAYDANYNTIGRLKVKNTPVYKQLHAAKDTSNNGYYYIGNHIVFDPRFVSKNKQPSIVDPNWKVDINAVLTEYSSRPTTASTHERKEKDISPYTTKSSPWFMKDGLTTPTPRRELIDNSSEEKSRPRSARKIRPKSPYLNSSTQSSSKKENRNGVRDFIL
ncbi:unnamed protein product [Blepharisma stoltei]|uniref:Uncharacterized protein n=1 Tax=Blepharisma stoltei TaxID=1481888 RepID=A0AAU9JT88_9CILI|nr:unnamed protein product [Blepharisma stoltei]